MYCISLSSAIITIRMLYWSHQGKKYYGSYVHMFIRKYILLFSLCTLERVSWSNMLPMQKEHVDFLHVLSDYVCFFFLYCMYDCNPRDVLFNCKYTNQSRWVPLKSDWRRSAGLREEVGVSSTNTQCEVKHQTLYKARFLLFGAHQRDISDRGGALTMWASVVLLVLLAVASHTAASKYRTCVFYRPNEC